MVTKLEALQAQMAQLQAMIEHEAKRDKVLASLKALAEKEGFTLQELMEPEALVVTEVKRRGRPAGGAPKEAKGPAVIKYRKGHLTWSGRGRRPQWYIDAEAAGEPMGQYLVMGADA